MQRIKRCNKLPKFDAGSTALGSPRKMNPPEFLYDIEVLDAFLSSEASPENCMMVSDLDGFLTAIAIGPDRINPSQWLPVIWRGEQAFEDPDQAERIIGMMLARYNEILWTLEHAEDDYCPWFWESADGAVIAMDWAEGFMEGVQLDPDSWVPLFEDDDGRTIFSPIVTHLHDENGNPLIGGDPRKMDAVYDQAAELIPAAVIALNNFWLARRLDT